MTLFHIEVAAEQDRAYSPQLWHRVYDTTEQEVRVNTTVIRSAVWFEGGAGEKAIKRLYSLYGGPVGTFQTLTLKDEAFFSSKPSKSWSDNEINDLVSGHHKYTIYCSLRIFC